MLISILDDEILHRNIALGFICISPPLYSLLRRRIAAPFGKHSSDGWGPTLNPRLAWCLFESPNLIVPWVLYQYTRIIDNNSLIEETANIPIPTVSSRILLSMYCGHYVNRCLIYPLRLGKGSHRVNIAVISSAFAFCTLNGYLQSLHYFKFHQYSDDAHTKPLFIMGFIIFVVGALINIYHDNILRDMRNQFPTVYQIPKRGLFNYISCANFTGEILEWLGYAVASNSIAGWGFFAWVCANLIPRAISHHEFYLQKFEDYPKHRWAVIPGWA